VWAASNGLDELRDHAEEKCPKEIYKKLAEKGIMKKLMDQGVSLDTLNKLVSKAASLMVEFLENANQTQ
jgi:hypothetical protein